MSMLKLAGTLMKMGWLLTGDAFPKVWQRAWQTNWELALARTGPFSSDHEVTLDFVRNVVQMASQDQSKATLNKVAKLGLKECFEPPTRTLAEIAAILKEAPKPDQPKLDNFEISIHVGAWMGESEDKENGGFRDWDDSADASVSLRLPKGQFLDHKQLNNMNYWIAKAVDDFLRREFPEAETCLTD